MSRRTTDFASPAGILIIAPPIRFGTRTVEMPGMGGMADVKTIGPDNKLRLVVTVAARLLPRPLPRNPSRLQQAETLVLGCLGN